MTTPPLTDEQQAKFLRESSTGVYLSSSVGACLGDVVTPTGFKRYLEELRQAAGNSTHPLEQMLWEQFAMAHHNLGRIYSQASGSKTINEVQIYSAVLIKLHAELRLLGETLNRMSKHDTSEVAHEAPKPGKKANSGDRSQVSGKQNTQLTGNEAGESDEPTVVPFTESASPPDGEINCCGGGFRIRGGNGCGCRLWHTARGHITPVPAPRRERRRRSPTGRHARRGAGRCVSCIVIWPRCERCCRPSGSSASS